MSVVPRSWMQLRFAAGTYRFRESLFGLPALIVLAGAVVAEVSGYIDRMVGPFSWGLKMNSNAAVWLLSTVAGATITTAGVVFSLTVVSLQLASSQFSPRVMRSFIRDRFSQTVIGMLVATFVYCVLTLRHIGADEAAPAPTISTTLAVVLAVATVVLIIAYLNRLAHGLQVGEVVRSIASEAEKVISDTGRSAHREIRAEQVPEPDFDDGATVYAPRDGWVTQAPADLVLAVVPAGTVVRLETRPGAYIHRGEPLLRVHPTPERAATLRRLESAVEISNARTMQEDVDFALRQLVDIALRALSQAINDPTTATEVVLRLGSLLRTLLITDSPAPVIAGPENRILLRPWILSPEEYIEHAFEQIRQAGSAQLHVATALARVLRMLLDYVSEHDRTEYVPALEHQLRLLVDAVVDRPEFHPEDVERFRAVAESSTDPAEHRLS
ncbi:DUF2254 domain-containing protein [Rhodococcus sp. CH91]|uniref:DUF2254 domain-containing protein n=1 Tax=Rhodococcus sp. CH91 TaxID=2910256 RepID=UPI001F4ACD18|nr:DUF2254 domain-containing protein [Rhodococcus sp. CH91]